MEGVEQITAYKYTFTPMDRSYPIRSVDVVVYAPTREEADHIVWGNAHKFFEQNTNVVVKSMGSGFRSKE